MEGRIEWEVSDGAYLYLASGDIMLDSSVTENKECSFPLSHYHGITITISVPEATDSMSDLLDLFSIDLSEIEKVFQRGHLLCMEIYFQTIFLTNFIMCRNTSAKNIFG